MLLRHVIKQLLFGESRWWTLSKQADVRPDEGVLGDAEGGLGRRGAVRLRTCLGVCVNVCKCLCV